MRILKTVFTALGLLATSTAAVPSGLIPLTDRDDLFGWEAVGRIDTKGSYCTGVLIAADLVLTAAHCVYDRRTGKMRPPESFTFSAGLRNGTSIATRTGAQVVAHADYLPRRGVTMHNIQTDVALLKLEKPISTFEAAPFAIHSGLRQGNSVSVVSYGRGRDSVLSWQRQCDVLGRGYGLIAFNCDVTFGSSGAPVFIKEGNRARIATLVSSGSNANGETVAYGMDLPENISTLKRALRAAPRKPSAGIKRIQVGTERASTGAKFIKN
jgi:protease YdgD